MTKDELVEDLAYVRALAEEGRHAPLIGGGFLVFFGVSLAIAYSLQWALLSDVFGQTDGIAYAFLWGGYGVVAALGGLLLRPRVRTLPGAASIVNRVDRAVWQCVSLAILVIVAGCIARMIIAHDDYAPNAIMASAFSLYGVALGVTATISNQSWLRIFAWLSFAASAALWLFMNETWTYLLAAGASVAVLILPGVMMIRRQPSPLV
jgi:hypothetical protein